MRRMEAVVAAVLLLGAPAAATELDRAAQARLGLETRVLQRERLPREVAGVARVLDPAPLARQLDELAVAGAAADAAGAEARRTRALLAANGNASRKALEAAQAQAASARARLDAARVALRTHWGAGLADLPPGQRKTLLAALLDGRSVLLAGEPTAVPPRPFQARTAVLQLAGGGEQAARVLGRLPQSRLGLAPGWLLQADGAALAPGMAMTARLQGRAPGAQGVLLPQAAIVRWNGMAWAYVATDPTHFQRRALAPLQTGPDGWLVGPPFRAGERVVTRGAAALVALDAAPVPGSADAPQDDDD